MQRKPTNKTDSLAEAYEPLVIADQTMNVQSLLWDNEYGTSKVIPSSTRELPSKALLLFSEIMNFENLKVLDAGCGIGRNSIYLARKGCEVHAVDVSEVALAKLNSTAQRAHLQEHIKIHRTLLKKPFPFLNSSFDLVLDSYVLCHFIDPELKQSYREELYRVTKPGGVVFSSLFSLEDEYYRKLIEKGHGMGSLVVDPNNGITKQLYSEDDIKYFFSVDFNLRFLVKFEFSDIVLGKPYLRSIFGLILEK